MVAITTAASFAQFYEVHISWIYSSTTSEDIPTMFPQCEPWVKVKARFQCWMDDEQSDSVRSLKHMLKLSKSTFLIWLTKDKLFSSPIIKHYQCLRATGVWISSCTWSLAGYHFSWKHIQYRTVFCWKPIISNQASILQNQFNMNQ